MEREGYRTERPPFLPRQVPRARGLPPLLVVPGLLLLCLFLAAASAGIGLALARPTLRGAVTAPPETAPAAVVVLLPSATAGPLHTVPPTPTVAPRITPSPTPSATLVPTATPIPSATPIAARFRGQAVALRGDCSRTAVEGAVVDALGRSLNGLHVRVWWPDAPPGQLYSGPTGSRADLGPGRYEVILDSQPRAGWWLVAVVDPEGQPLGEAIVIETTAGDCDGSGGRQRISVDFTLESGAAGQPGPAPLPTAVATLPPTAVPATPPPALPTPTPAPTPDGIPRQVAVPILMYHYISDPPPGSSAVRVDLSVSPGNFRAHLVALREAGFSPISLIDLLFAIQQGRPLPPRPVVITFDDGYRDHFEQALPILLEQGFTGTFFVVSDLHEERNVNYMTWEQIVALRDAGMEIGGHTRTHASLPGLSRARIWEELAGSRALLEARLGQEVRVMAYPYGDFDAGVAHLAFEAGYWLSVTTQQGALHSSNNLMTLRRIRVRNTTTPTQLLEAIDYWLYEAPPPR